MKMGLTMLLLPAAWMVDATEMAKAGKVAVPGYINVSEVSKDGHSIHNRLTFDCRPPQARKIDCVVVQQNVQEPPSTTPAQLDQAVSELGDVLKSCNDRSWKAPPTIDEPQYLTAYRKQFAVACDAKDRAAAAAALRRFYEIESQACKLMTIVFRWTLLQVDKDTWTVEQEPFPVCENVSIKRTLHRDPVSPDSWNYTESVVAKPIAGASTLCQAKSGTTHFTWGNAVTARDLRCRYLAM